MAFADGRALQMIGQPMITAFLIDVLRICSIERLKKRCFPRVFLFEARGRYDFSHASRGKADKRLDGWIAAKAARHGVAIPAAIGVGVAFYGDKSEGIARFNDTAVRKGVDDDVVSHGAGPGAEHSAVVPASPGNEAKRAGGARPVESGIRNVCKTLSYAPIDERGAPGPALSIKISGLLILEDRGPAIRVGCVFGDS